MWFFGVMPRTRETLGKLGRLAKIWGRNGGFFALARKPPGDRRVIWYFSYQATRSSGAPDHKHTDQRYRQDTLCLCLFNGDLLLIPIFVLYGSWNTSKTQQTKVLLILNVVKQLSKNKEQAFTSLSSILSMCTFVWWY